MCNRYYDKLANVPAICEATQSMEVPYRCMLINRAGVEFLDIDEGDL